jgi:hypothetical protein
VHPAGNGHSWSNGRVAVTRHMRRPMSTRLLFTCRCDVMSHSTQSEIVDFICILMIVLGSLGNTLGLIVFSSRKFRRTSYARLAIASLVINLLCVFRYSLLLHSETRRWITYKVGLSWFNCKLYRLSSCLRILSAFVTVVWTYERFTYVTSNFHFFSSHQWKVKLKFFVLISLSLLLIAALTGPTVYFYEAQAIAHPQRSSEQRAASLPPFTMPNASESSGELAAGEQLSADMSSNRSYLMVCGLKASISLSWRSFLVDVGFGLNYTTFRSIFSEVIPSILVICFNIGIIFRVVQSSLSFSSQNLPGGNVRPVVCQGSFQSKDPNNGLMVHNRPRTSWMNLVLILHSCLFFFSSLTATIVHWSTADALLSYWISVVILANCSLNFYVYCLSGKSFRQEIRKLLRNYFQVYCTSKLMNLFRSKAERDDVGQAVRMRLVGHRNTLAAVPMAGACRTTSSIQ